MHIVYEVRRPDLEGLLQYHYEHSAVTKSSRVLAGVLLPAVMIAVFVLAGIAQGAWVLALLGIVVGLAMRAALPRVMRWSIRASVSRSLAQGTTSASLGRHELALSEEGLVDRGLDQEYRYTWDEIVDVVELSDRVYVYLGPSQAYVIPRDGVREGDYLGFVQRLKEGIAASKGEAQG